MIVGMQSIASLTSLRREFVCLMLVLAGCNSTPAPVSVSDDTRLAQSRDELMTCVDGQVTIVGKALREADYKDRRPNVLIADGTRVEIAQLDAWPNELRGRRVTATGVLRRRTPPGPFFQSPAPEWFVIEQAQVERAGGFAKGQQ
jgi:hypothetical protein